jgi:hypothetical protein
MEATNQESVASQKSVQHGWNQEQGGIINKSCVLCVQQGEQQVTQQFYVTNLGQDCIILGYLLRFTGTALICAYIWHYCAYVMHVHCMTWTDVP